MPDHPPICPNCDYDLTGHISSDTEGMNSIACPECGVTTSVFRARKPKPIIKHPNRLKLIAAIVVLLLSLSCITGYLQELIFGTLSRILNA
tara:strand:+ start:65 stop:337 length:273 start_codon:yes stop_codon:yes gene_type:complete